MIYNFTGKVFGSLECNSKLDEATSDLCSSAPNEHVDGEVMSSISMNGTYVLEDEIILKEFLEEIHVSTEGKLCEDCDLDLESPYFQDSDCVTAVDTEGKFLEGNDSSESRILSDLRNSSESNISTFSSDDSALIRVSLEDSKKYLDDDLAHVDFRSIDCGNPVNFPEESSSVSEFCCDELPNVETSGASNDRFLSHQEMKSVHLKPSDDQLIQVLCELDQSERELDESENPSNEAIQNIVSLIGNEQSDEGMDVPLEDEQTLEEESTYSIFKFLVHEEKDRNQFSDVDNNADVCQESQQNEPNVISSRISSPNMIVGSGSCNFISLEAWIDDTSGMDTDLQEDQHEKESQNVETHAIDPVVESSGQHFEDGHNEELDVDQNGLSQTFDFKVRALSPVTRGSFSSEEPKKGKEGFMLKARVEHFIQKLEEKSLVGSVSGVNYFLVLLSTPHFPGGKKPVTPLTSFINPVILLLLSLPSSHASALFSPYHHASTPSFPLVLSFLHCLFLSPPHPH